MSNLWIKTRIPHGSRLEMAVRGRTPADEPKFTARANVVREDHTETEWPQATFRPGPRIEGPIGVGARWVVRVEVLFADDADAQVLALVRRPDNVIFGSRYRYRFSGTAGEVVRATLLLRSET